MTDNERDVLLGRLDERTATMVKHLASLPCAEERATIVRHGEEIAVLKNQSARRNGIAAGLGALAAAVTMIGKWLVGKV